MKSSERTKDNIRSEMRTTVSKIDRAFFQLYCEDNAVLEQSMANLIELSNSEDSGIRLQANKFLVEQLIGRPSQSTDITSKGESITPSLIFGNVLKEGEDDNTTEN